MQKRALGKTGIEIAPIVFGGNVFGWTLDERESFRILDAFVDQGFNAIDTADSYSTWVSGNKGGESETIIGNWLRARPALRDIFARIDQSLASGGLLFVHQFYPNDQKFGLAFLDSPESLYRDYLMPAGFVRSYEFTETVADGRVQLLSLHKVRA